MLSKNEAITICSVSYNSWDFLTLNWDLVSRLNRGNSGWKWVIVNNGSKTTSEPAFVPNGKCFITNGDQADDRVPIEYRGSFHHGVGLNKSLSYVDTRFTLFLDPDFFIVFGQDWINSVVGYMLQNDLSFFGVPWHPKWYIKYRYFPCPHCLFIDLKKISVETLDFTPDYDINHFSNAKQSKRSLRKTGYDVQKSMSSAQIQGNGLAPIKDFFRFMKKMSIHSRQRRIGWSRDTGFKIYQRYGHNPKVKYEGTIPIYKPHSTASVEQFIVSPLNRFIELFLPERLTYLPKRRHLYSPKGFKESGYPDIDRLGWEEFLWKQKPFGFHLRSQQLTKPKTQSDVDFLRGILKRFAP